MTVKIDKLAELVTSYLREPPFAMASTEKETRFLNLLNELTNFHVDNCHPYQKIIEPIFGLKPSPPVLSAVPFIPVRLFKSLELKSVETESVMKMMTSSGTTGQQVSRVLLDRHTSSAQTRALGQIMSDVLGKGRFPMLVADTSSVVKDRTSFSARGAGIRGFSMFGRDVEYMLDDQMKLRTEEVSHFLTNHSGQPIFVFGFTFMVWEHVCEELLRLGKNLNLSEGILLHGGGWKKLSALNIDNEMFKRRVKDSLGVSRVVNYYGMVEQTGSIFPECEFGRLHSSAYSEVIIRSPQTLEETPDGSEGLIQLLSVLPMSYPGHSILTEDVGVIDGRDDCPCGRPGRYFRVLGRLKEAEIRGCSDTFSA